jgi:hypothetical protein
MMSAIEQPQSRMSQIDAARTAPERPRIETICLLFLSSVAICDHIETLQPIGHLLGEGK